MKDEFLHKHLCVFTPALRDTYLRPRAHETKLGEGLSTPSAGDWQHWLQTTSARFILVGLSEDIGVRANAGMGGAHTLWEPFLSVFLNMLDNPHLSATSLGILGTLRPPQRASSNTLASLREQVCALDEHVTTLLTLIASAGKIPIVLGGGHNNVFPILRAMCQTRHPNGMHVVNLDAHTDLRVKEGRHSGNGFSYALHEGYLKRYAVIGVHQYYTPAYICEQLHKDPRLRVWWYEDIFFSPTTTAKDAYKTALTEARQWIGGSSVGLELDLDVMTLAPSSARTPYGLSGAQTRHYVRYMTHQLHPAYFHLCEGMHKDEQQTTHPLAGKYAAYLVADFLAGCAEKNLDDNISYHAA